MKTVFSILIIISALSHSQSQSQLLFDEIRLTEAREAFGLTGKGSIVAILDRGIDYRHPDFIDADGNTRILAIWDLSDDTGSDAANNPYGKGTIYDKATINEALASGVPLATRDASGHGTVTAGVAAGAGGSSTSGIMGIAPEAKIIVVKITSEGAPAHGSQLEEASFYASTYIDEAIQFIKTKATEVGLPVSMIANFGSIQGPMDGTSSFSRMLDMEFSDSSPGVAFTCGSSDDGGLNNHVGINLETGFQYEFYLDKKTSPVRMDLWYDSQDQVSFQIERNDTIYEIPPLEGISDAANLAVPGFVAYHRGADLDFFSADNDRNELLMDFEGANDEIKIIVVATAIVGGKLDAMINPSNIFLAERNEFRNFTVEGSIWDLASSKNNLCPNSYILRDGWESAAGETYTYPGHENGVGSLWTGSGVGPTLDGRIGIDISVPGNINYGAYAPDSYFASFSSNVVENGTYPYGVIAAVSGANPVLAGVVALMLEANPELSAPEIKKILQKTARADSFTGDVPNTTWGYGKLDVFAALSEVYNPTSVYDKNPTFSQFSIRPNPMVGNTITVADPPIDAKLDVTILSINGEVVKRYQWNAAFAKEKEVDISALPAGLYLINLTGNQLNQTRKVVKN